MAEAQQKAQAGAPKFGASRPSLSLVMCAHDEEAGLEDAVKRSTAALERCAGDFEIIIVDDGSTDRTGEIADRLAAADERVRVLHNESNLNYGVSLKRGIDSARCEFLFHDGVDLPLAPEDLPEFLPALPGADVVVVSRHDRSAHSPWRVLTSWGNAQLLRLLFRPRCADLNFVQFYRTGWVQSVPLRSTSPAFVTPELILRAERSGGTLREVRAEFRKRETGRAHFGRPKDILWTLRDMLRLRLHTWLRGWAR